MVRLCLTVAAVVTSAFGSIGCSGQNVEGAWTGDFPLEGSRACTIRLESGSRFTVSCDQHAVVGGGRYQWDGRYLALNTTLLTYGGKVVKSKPRLTFSVEGGGNVMRLRCEGASYTWRRSLGARP